MTAILRVRDGNGDVVDIPAIKGKDGYTPIKGIDYFDGTDGKDGKDGYTPIKGVDYFTEADKQEIINDVLEIVDSGMPFVINEQGLLCVSVEV